jgi:hypothetical protein
MQVFVRNMKRGWRIFIRTAFGMGKTATKTDGNKKPAMRSYPGWDVAGPKAAVSAWFSQVGCL